MKQLARPFFLAAVALTLVSWLPRAVSSASATVQEIILSSSNAALK